MKDISVMPAPGRLVRHPETGERVPESGMAVPRVPYWLRRIKDGDIVPADTMADGSRAACRADSAEAAPTELASGGMTADSKRVKDGDVLEGVAPSIARAKKEPLSPKE